MKIKDVAHNHSLTDLLKVSIFSLLMLAPMINVGVRSAYVICNKNAYQSYYGETINEVQYQFVDVEDLVPNTKYRYEQTIYTTSSSGLDCKLYYEDLEWITGNVSGVNNPDFTINETNNLLIYMPSADRITIEFYKDNNNYNYYSINAINKYIVFNYTYKSRNNTNSTNWNYFNNNYLITYNNYSFLDNVFEYSVNQLTESPLYNWVENTAIYSGVALMNTQLGITQPVISLLVVYWLLLTIIYVIIDIVIRVFTWLTHMIGSKTA